MKGTLFLSLSKRFLQLTLLFCVITAACQSRSNNYSELSLKINKLVGVIDKTLQQVITDNDRLEYTSVSQRKELYEKVQLCISALNNCYKKRAEWIFIKDFTNEDVLEFQAYADLLFDAFESGKPDSLSLIMDFITEESTMKWNRDIKTSDDKIKITIKVFDRNQKELSGYIPFCIPKYHKDSSLVLQFNPTKNAISMVKAGSKYFWIKKDGKVIQNQKRLEILSVGEKEKLIIFQL